MASSKVQRVQRIPAQTRIDVRAYQRLEAMAAKKNKRFSEYARLVLEAHSKGCYLAPDMAERLIGAESR